ncbi:MAG: metallo-mystery pair system four-Cys motif protein, partial [Vicinamibacterales bacterium]|nr:metallo-mystery pair system four-Cys motif protein [Vicinamibacterales bacterium]
MSLRRSLASLLVSLAGVTLGCDADGGDPLDLHFRATVGETPLGCGATHALGLGATPSTLVDLRLYVHDVRLIDTAGAEHPFTLADDGRWQGGDVALLDFEDRTGACGNGTAETRTFIRGAAPSGDYRGLAFRVGVPEHRNHADAATAPSPLNLSRMFWSWTAGYKYLRLDLLADGAGWNVHLGATACTGNPVTGISCANPNRPEIRLDPFDLGRDVVILDVAALLAA